MKVKLTKVDVLSSIENDVDLELGKHVIGRADFKCEDKRISRQHIEIDILACGSVTLTPLHINPVFYRSSGSGSVTTVPLVKGEIRAIYDGDQISLLPGSLWFTINFVNDSKDMVHLKEAVQHKIDPDEREAKTSMKKVDGNDNCVGHNANPSSDIVPVHFETQDNSSLITEPNAGSPCIMNDDTVSKLADGKSLDELEDVFPVKIKRENDAESTSESGPSAKKPRSASTCRDAQCDNSPVNVKTETAKEEIPEAALKEEEASGSGNGNGNATGAGTDPPARPLCMYGAACYRRNPVHRSDFSHPSDADWRTPPDCQYGAACYRRSQRHRSKYNHLGPPAPRPPEPAGAGRLMRVERFGDAFYLRVNYFDEAVHSEDDSADRKRNRAAKGKRRHPSWSGSGSDDYDPEDPFLDDNSSDDYRPSSSSYTSDSSD